MVWILLALLAPLFWAGSNILDKHILDKVSRGSYDFLFFGTIGSFFIVILTLLVFGLEQISVIVFVPIVAGFFLQYSYLFYSYALKREDASYVVPLYITYSVVVLILSPLFGETITKPQLVSFVIIFLGVFFLALKKLSLQLFGYRKGALLMAPAVLLLGLYVLFINQSLKSLSFTDTFIYDLIGYSLAGISLMLVPRWRAEIISGLRVATARKYILFLIIDTFDTAGLTILKFALLLAPSVGLVAVLGGVQPFYVLILGFLLTIFFPKIIKENITRREVIQKVIGVTIIVTGIAVLNLYS